MKNKPTLLLLCAAILCFFSSCLEDKEVKVVEHYYTPEDYEVLNKKLNLATSPEEYDVAIPRYIANLNVRIQDNVAVLGRVLFYDPLLSKNNAVSCASCHDQSLAFADPVAFSEGFEGGHTKRNSYAIGSTASTRQYYDISRPTLFWDNRARTVTEQSDQTIQNAIEMGMDFTTLSNKLRKEDYYQILFKKAYPNHPDPYNKQNILRALEEFVLSLVSTDSKFDEGYKHLTNPAAFNPSATLSNFTDAENRGKQLFMNNCASCHGQTFSLATIPAANNGLDMEYTDNGIGELTGVYTDDGVFKVPIIRNVELTAPYMHDGRFATLEDVIDHYSEGIQDHPNLHSTLKDPATGKAKKMNFTDQEKADLVAFLKTTTDNKFVTTERWSDPFKR